VTFADRKSLEIAVKFRAIYIRKRFAIHLWPYASEEDRNLRHIAELNQDANLFKSFFWGR